MEKLLHYAWRHRLYPVAPLVTTDGQPVEVIDPGLPNHDAGPDFFNAKVNIGGTLWVGNVEIHLHSSDWRRHGHASDSAYDNVVLHVVADADAEVATAAGRLLPQLVLPLPASLSEGYEELLSAERYPPCYRIVPQIDKMVVHGWLNALAAERLEEKAARIRTLVGATTADWEYVCFCTLARNFGFGVNGDAFEEWARHVDLSQVGKHRDSLFQVEAYFFGQAGLLDKLPDEADEYPRRLREEYDFLSRKFGLESMSPARWRFLRLRPQNFPHVRLAQLARLYHEGRAEFARLLEAESVSDLHACLSASVSPYWETHYAFGHESPRSTKTLRAASLDLLVINTVVPLLFAYGRWRHDDRLCERAFGLLEQLKPENNHIIRAWREAGVEARCAADSQALVHLRRNYCDRKDCLRCRFGYEYLKSSGTGLPSAPAQ